MDYVDMIYAIADKLPRSEDFNLKSQIIRAATSIQLNIAEGSTSQSDAEQSRFIGLAIRSLIETVACQHQISRRGYSSDPTPLREAYKFSETLFAKLQALRHSLATSGSAIREQPASYGDTEDPF